MRIVILRSTDISPDPRVEKEAFSLGRHEHEVHIVGWDRERNHLFEEDVVNSYGQHTPVTRIGIQCIYGGGGKNIVPLLKFQVKLAEWLFTHRSEYDCIHACDLNTGATALFVARALKKKLVYDIFDYFPEAYPVPERLRKVVAWVEDRVIYGANAVIICSEKRIEQIRYNGRKERLHVIHNTPIYEEQREQTLSCTASRIKIVYVGILQSERYIEELLEIVGERDDLELHIGGFGVLESMIKEKSRKHSNIFFYGKLKYEDTIKLESQADIMTALYKYNIEHRYAAPNKFYEALMLGKPLLMAKDTGMDHIVHENKIGVVIGWDVSTLEEAINLLIKQKNNWGEMAFRMKTLYAEQFSWDMMEKRLIRLYDNLN